MSSMLLYHLPHHSLPDGQVFTASQVLFEKSTIFHSYINFFSTFLETSFRSLKHTHLVNNIHSLSLSLSLSLSYSIFFSKSCRNSIILFYRTSCIWCYPLSLFFSKSCRYSIILFLSLFSIAQVLYNVTYTLSLFVVFYVIDSLSLSLINVYVLSFSTQM